MSKLSYQGTSLGTHLGRCGSKSTNFESKRSTNSTTRVKADGPLGRAGRSAREKSEQPKQSWRGLSAVYKRTVRRLRTHNTEQDSTCRASKSRRRTVRLVFADCPPVSQKSRRSTEEGPSCRRSKVQARTVRGLETDGPQVN